MLIDLCKKHEGFETDGWAARAILEVELMTAGVWDPCCGTGILTYAALKKGYSPWTSDIVDWSVDLDCPTPNNISDFLIDPPAFGRDLLGTDFTVFMNPPFSLACEFVDRARHLGARKIICFQRWSWRESKARRDWWAANPPARMWICGERATCWRFDIPRTCPEPGTCPNRPSQKRVAPAFQCRKCMQGTPTSHGWFVWERGHRGIEATGSLWKDTPHESNKSNGQEVWPRPAGHTLDRHPNPNGHYEPGNCRWASKLEQRHNRRSHGKGKTDRAASPALQAPHRDNFDAGAALFRATPYGQVRP